MDRAHRGWSAWWRQPGKVALFVAGSLLACVLGVLTATGWVEQFDLRIYFDAVNYWRAGNDLYGYAQPDPIMGSLGFTYPPFAAVLMTPMTLLEFDAVRALTLVGIGVAGSAMVALILVDCGVRPGRALTAGTLVATPLAFMVESMRENVTFGQINVFLGVLVLADFLLLARRAPRWFGVGTGIAAALKVTPGIFVLYLLVTRRWRAAATAVAAAAVATGLAAVVAPSETWRFFTGLLWDTTRVGRPESVLNQSVNGWLARWAAPEAPPRLLWAVLAAAILVGGLWRAARLYARGDDLAGLAVAGLVGVCVSPVSWMHHAVWVLPALAVVTHRWWQLRGRPAGGPARRGLALLGLTGALTWGMQPTSYIRTEIADWPDAAAFTVLLSGLPLLWCVAAVAFLPARDPAGPPSDRVSVAAPTVATESPAETGGEVRGGC